MSKRARLAKRDRRAQKHFEKVWTRRRLLRPRISVSVRADALQKRISDNMYDLVLRDIMQPQRRPYNDMADAMLLSFIKLPFTR